MPRQTPRSTNLSGSSDAAGLPSFPLLLAAAPSDAPAQRPRRARKIGAGAVCMPCQPAIDLIIPMLPADFAYAYSTEQALDEAIEKNIVLCLVQVKNWKQIFPKAKNEIIEQCTPLNAKIEGYNRPYVSLFLGLGAGDHSVKPAQSQISLDWRCPRLEVVLSGSPAEIFRHAFGYAEDLSKAPLNRTSILQEEYSKLQAVLKDYPIPKVINEQTYINNRNADLDILEAIGPLPSTHSLAYDLVHHGIKQELRDVTGSESTESYKRALRTGPLAEARLLLPHFPSLGWRSLST